jgi:methylenetetrahydrofolate reductase (NADPH)
MSGSSPFRADPPGDSPGESARRATTLADALRQIRYEVIPLKGIEDRVSAVVPAEVKMTVTVSPRKGLDATIETAGRLVEDGYEVVPHLAARMVRDRFHLAELLSRLKELGIGEVFVVAGDIEQPLGEFAGADELLPVMAEIGHELKAIGITGYPESHPFIPDDVTIQSMWDKRRYATYIVSQICFRPSVFSEWVSRVRRRGVRLPIFAGIPGAVEMTKLIRVTARVGVGESARFLGQHTSWVLHLLRPGGYRPDRLLSGLGPLLSDEQANLAGFHVFTFNDVEDTERWRQRLIR